MRLSLFAQLEGLIAPAPDRDRVAFLAAQPYAHRGLHGRGIIENSRAAFAAAIATGHGIELDVQVSRDGEPFVFHDERFERLTHEVGAISETHANDVSAIKLAGCEETIPRLAEVLDLVAGRVPVLIEVKAGPVPMGAVCLSIRRLLEGYPGKIGVMSFNPEVGRWFRNHAPRVVRGLVITEDGKRNLRGRLERGLSEYHAKPDFIAYDVKDLPHSTFAARNRKRGLPVLTWTVRTTTDERIAAAFADEIIYEVSDSDSP